MGIPPTSSASYASRCWWSYHSVEASQTSITPWCANPSCTNPVLLTYVRSQRASSTSSSLVNSALPNRSSISSSSSRRSDQESIVRNGAPAALANSTNSFQLSGFSPPFQTMLCTSS